VGKAFINASKATLMFVKSDITR